MVTNRKGPKMTSQITLYITENHQPIIFCRITGLSNAI